MSYGIKLRVWGEFALFSRPEMKAERVSYDVPTPSAARGIIEAIYWKPQIRWVIDKIHVLKPIRFTNIRRNEVDQKLPPGNVKKAMKGGEAPSLHVEDHRQQRASLLLKDVDYIFEARFEILDPTEQDGSKLADPTGKHLDMFNRRASVGQFHHAPVLGCREFPAHFSLVEEDPPVSELQGETDLGFMLYDIDFTNNMTPIFYRARMTNGVIDVRKCYQESNVKG
jgi:CRISPR-associated protein Cas5d